MGIGCTNGACGTNGTCGTILISTKDKLESETCVMNATIIDNDVTKSHSPDEDIPKVIFDSNSNSSNRGEDSLVTFFWIFGSWREIWHHKQECSLSSSTRFCLVRCWELPWLYWTNFLPKNYIPFQFFPKPLWVHVFGKSTKSSSLRTQGASVVYTEQQTNKNTPSLQSSGHEET